MFIVVEGPDGSGKTTLIESMAKHYTSYGLDIVVTREPGGTPMAEEIRETLLQHREERVWPATEIMLFNAARNQHNLEVIQPALHRGRIVICDRYYISTFVYQCLLGNVPEQYFHDLNNMCGHIAPDVVVHLAVTPEESILRQTRLRLDRMDTLFEDRKHLVYAYDDAVRRLQKTYGYRLVEVDTTGRPPSVVADHAITRVGVPIKD